MLSKILCPLAVAIALGGCSTVPLAPSPEQLPWQDARFGYDAALVTVAPADVFRLDPGLAALLAAPELHRLGAAARADRLLTLIFGRKGDQFAYRSGHSTVAAETWQRRQGDCLSLTVLAYAAARALGLDAEVQEVRVPALHVRRDGFDFVNHHVNLLVRVPPVNAEERPRQLVVDFDPEASAGAGARSLAEHAVVARMYGNLGAEFLTRGDRRRAYAHLKMALALDRSHAASYTNIALLYRNEGLDGDAERFLRHAIALGVHPETAMRALLELLREQDRSAEAQALAEQLRARQEADPSYWTARGARELAEGRPAEAVRSLKRAQALAVGFAEVHRQLALAYWQLGKREHASEQLSLLAAADPASPLPLKLNKQLPPAR